MSWMMVTIVTNEEHLLEMVVMIMLIHLTEMQVNLLGVRDPHFVRQDGSAFVANQAKGAALPAVAEGEFELHREVERLLRVGDHDRAREGQSERRFDGGW